ncbi:tRNA-dihydrouridine synthase family protein [Oligoflexaceae bacterium]|nr:tRNA-dihydrouridine synthase family protein [Oligoflexaceae bacterium]
MKAALAPMEGVTDWPFRLWMGMIGGFTEATTPFLRVTDTFPNETLPFSYTPDARASVDYQLTPQLMASDPKRFTEVAHQVLNDFDFVELNCGCPSPKVFSHGAGSQLLADSKYFASFVSQIVNDLGPQRLAVKIRLGLELHSEVFSIADALANLPLRRLTVHGRTKKDRYRGSTNWGVIAFLQRQLPFPVIGSGDITSEQAWRRVQRSSHHNRTLVGRGALRNPWIFRQLNLEESCIPDSETIIASMKCLYHLHDLAMTAADTLDELSQGKLLFSIGEGKQEWLKNLQLLENTQPSRLPNRHALGRVKLLWNYFRSSLPFSITESAAILRAKDFAQFIDNIGILFSKTQPFEKTFITYSQSYDWVYNGGRHEQRAQLT